MKKTQKIEGKDNGNIEVSGNLLTSAVIEKNKGTKTCKINHQSINVFQGKIQTVQFTNIYKHLKTCLSNNIENIFIDLLFPKTKPITVGVIYKPPNQTRFLEQIITEFETLDLHNEHHVLGDFNINLLFKGKYIFDKPDEFRQFYKELSPEIKKYTEFCSTYGFKQLIKGPTRTTRSTSTLIDHILTNTDE